jgi:hypothetical protein
MITVDFTTSSPLSNGGLGYLVNDLSTGTGSATAKRVIITSGVTGNTLSDTGPISPSTNPIVIDPSAWPIADRSIILVQLSYSEPGSAGSLAQKGYLAPLTVNIPTQF